MTDMTASAVGSAGNIFPLPRPATRCLWICSSPRPAATTGAAANATCPRARRISLVTVSVPPNHRPGTIETPSFGRANPEKHFTLVRSRRLGEPSMAREVATHLSGRIGSNRDVLVFVHGFNTSLEEARFRLAQIVADGRFGGVPILFTWPAQDGLLAYGSAKENATVSRDALTAMLNEISALPSVGRVHVLAHSMGAWLAMEALRRSAIGNRTLLNGRLGNVMLAAPDIDVAVFRQQMARLQGANVSVFASTSDRALNLSSRLVGERARVGAINPADASDRAELDRLGVKVYDLSAFSDGWINHGAYASVPDVVRQIGAQIARPRAEDAREISVIDGGVIADQRPARAAVIESQPLPAPAASAQP